jgi:hypothetical protein
MNKSMVLHLLGLHQEMKKLDRRDQRTIFTRNHEFKVHDKITDLCIARRFLLFMNERFRNILLMLSFIEADNQEAAIQELFPLENTGQN